jgi:hypothetical protein
MKTNNFLLAAGTALALAFLACEEKGKKAEPGGGESNVQEVEAEATEADGEYFMGDSEEDYELEDSYTQLPLEWLDENNSKYIRQAAILASKSFVFEPFPESYFTMQGDDLDSKFSNLDGMIDVNDEYGYGKAFKILFKRAYNQKEKDIGDWLQPLIKRIASLIPREKYVDNGWDAMVRQLLVAHDDLAAHPNAFSKMYEMMDSQSWKWEEVNKFVRDDEQFKVFVFEREGWSYLKGAAVVWAYSFWGRRYHENPSNIKPIAATLHMLRDELFASNEAVAETKCPDKITPLQTAEAKFLRNSSWCGKPPCAVFDLSSGNSIWLDVEAPVDLKKDTKVSLTYQKKQYWDSSGKDCVNTNVLKSMEILPEK